MDADRSNSVVIDELDELKKLLGEPATFVEAGRRQLGPQRVASRKDSENAARELLDRTAGRMMEGEASQFGRTFNTDFEEKERFNRFAPAFHGATMQALVHDLALLGLPWGSPIPSAGTEE